MSKHVRGFERIDDGTEVQGANRREVLLGAGGLAAVAAVGRSTADKSDATPTVMTGEIIGVGTFEVLAFSWGVSNSGTTHVGGGAGAGKANFQDLSLTRYVDTLSPVLMKAVASGQHFTKAIITSANRRSRQVIRYELSEVLATSLSTGGSSSELRLTENLTLNFARVLYTVNTVPAGWDIPQNRPL